MRQQSFFDWLEAEVFSSKKALVSALEIRDRTLYIQAPALRKKYMELIGIYEAPVLESELEVSLLRRKLEMIRIAINRREPIDLAAIAIELSKEKKLKVSELENADLTLKELPELSEEQLQILQSKYRAITSSYHPAVNTEMTDVQRELYQKAVEAYKMQDVEAISLIYDLLFTTSNYPDLFKVNLDTEEPTFDEKREAYRKIATEFSVDYTLAKELYELFAPVEDDFVILDNIGKYNAKRNEVEEEISRIRSAFPFNAESTISNPTKTEEYIAELRLRASDCEKKKTELESQIASLLEGKDVRS